MSASGLVYPSGCLPVNPSLSTSEVILRLRTLFEALKALADEACLEDSEPKTDPHVYQNLLEHLIKPGLLNHSSDEVKIWLACCISNLMGLFAPKCPFESSVTIKTVLMFFVRQLGGLSNTEGALFSRYLYLLESLCVFNIMNLALLLKDEAEDVVRALVRTGLGVASEKVDDMEMRVHRHISSCCSQILQALDEVTYPILDAIFFYLVAPQKTNNKESYRMARDLILRNQSILEPYISIFLSYAVCNNEMPPGCDLVHIGKLHDLIYEMHGFAPDIVRPLLDNLLMKITADNESDRMDVVNLFGLLLGGQRSKLAEEMPRAWTEFMKRFSDVSLGIRKRCVKLSLDILVFHPELRGQLSDLLVARTYDQHDAVRLEVITVVNSLAKKKFEAVSEKLLECVAERTRDKKPQVRREAIRIASLIYRLVMIGDEYSSSERSSVLIMAKQIVNFYCMPYLEDRILIEKVFVSNLVPYKAPAEKRVRILIEFFLSLDPRQAIWCKEILQKQWRVRRSFQTLLDLLKDEEANKERIVTRLHALCEFEAERTKSFGLFRRFAKFVLSDARSELLMSYILKDGYESSKVEAAVIELTKRMRDKGEDSAALATSFLERCAPLQFDRFAAEALLLQLKETFVSFLRQEESITGAKILRILDLSVSEEKILRLLDLFQAVTEAYPKCFATENSLKIIAEILRFNSNVIVEGCVTALHPICFRVSDNDGESCKATHKALLETCAELAVTGTPRTAKYAVRCIAKMLTEEDGQAKLKKLVETLLPHMAVDDPLCGTALKAFGSCMESFPGIFKDSFSDVMRDKVAAIAMHDPQEWEATEESSEKDNHYKRKFSNKISDRCLLKIFALRFMCTYSTSLPEAVSAEETESLAQQIPTRCIHLFGAVLKLRGRIFTVPLSENDAGHFRAVAAACLLKVATIPVHAQRISMAEFLELSKTVYDELRFVRRYVFAKLHKHLRSMRLSVDYMGIFAVAPLARYNDNDDTLQQVRGFIDTCIVVRNKFFATTSEEHLATLAYHKAEYCVAYAVYILSRRVTLDSHSNVEALNECAECLWFLIERFVARKDIPSLKFISNIFAKLKFFADAEVKGGDFHVIETAEQNKKIWALAELGITMMLYRAKIEMPDDNSISKLFLSKRFFSYHKFLQGNSRKVYLPAELVELEKNRMVAPRRRRHSSTASETLLPAPTMFTAAESQVKLAASSTRERRELCGKGTAKQSTRGKGRGRPAGRSTQSSKEKPKSFLRAPSDDELDNFEPSKKKKKMSADEITDETDTEKTGGKVSLDVPLASSTPTKSPRTSPNRKKGLWPLFTSARRTKQGTLETAGTRETSAKKGSEIRKFPKWQGRTLKDGEKQGEKSSPSKPERGKRSLAQVNGVAEADAEDKSEKRVPSTPKKSGKPTSSEALRHSPRKSKQQKTPLSAISKKSSPVDVSSRTRSSRSQTLRNVHLKSNSVQSSNAGRSSTVSNDASVKKRLPVSAERGKASGGKRRPPKQVLSGAKASKAAELPASRPQRSTRNVRPYSPEPVAAPTKNTEISKKVEEKLQKSGKKVVPKTVQVKKEGKRRL